MLALGVAVSFATAPVEAAAESPPWSDPLGIDVPAAAGGPVLAYGRDGSALVAWPEGGDRAPARRSSRIGLAALSVDGRLVRTRSLRGQLAAAPLSFGARGVIVLRERAARAHRSGLERVHLDAVMLTTAGAVRRVRRLGTFVPAVDQVDVRLPPAMAVSDRGELAVGWVELHPRAAAPAGGVSRLRLAIRRPGRGFAAPRTVATRLLHRLGSVAMAYGSGGRLLLAYGARWAVVEARVGVAGALGRPQRLARARPGWKLTLSAAVTAGGAMLVAWSTKPDGECPTFAKNVLAAVRPAGAARFARAQLLEPGEIDECEPLDIELAVSSSGTVTVAWSVLARRGDQATRAVRVAESDGSGRFGAPVELGTGDLGDLEAGADGSMLIVWRELAQTFEWPYLRPEPGRILASLRAPGASAFQPAEAVSDAAEAAYAPDGAFDPRTGRATVAWRAAALAGDPPMAVAGSAGLRLSSRQATVTTGG